MAQWIGGYSGNTHDTRVAEAEEALRLAIARFEGSSESDKEQVLQRVRKLAERVLRYRAKAARARLAALADRGRASEATRLKTVQQAPKEGSSEAILEEFGFSEA